MAVPWDQLTGESSKAYAAFCLYRDQGPGRSLDAASHSYHGHTAASGAPTTPVTPTTNRTRRASGQIRCWAERWHWIARARAWDEELERVKRRKQVEAVTEMADRHAREAMLLQNKAVARLHQLLPEELKPRDILSFLIEAAKLERLSRGEPTERVAEEHHFSDVKEMSDEDLASIVAAGQGLPPPGGHGTVPTPDGASKPS